MNYEVMEASTTKVLAELYGAHPEHDFNEALISILINAFEKIRVLEEKVLTLEGQLTLEPSITVKEFIELAYETSQKTSKKDYDIH